MQILDSVDFGRNFWKSVDLGCSFAVRFIRVADVGVNSLGAGDYNIDHVVKTRNPEIKRIERLR